MGEGLNKTVSISEIVKLARAAGMTYGEYVQAEYIKSNRLRGKSNDTRRDDDTGKQRS